MKVVKLWVLVLGLGWGLVCWGQDGTCVSGDDCFQRGQFELAVQTWEELRSKVSPNDAGAYVDLSVRVASAYKELGRIRQSLNALRCAEFQLKNKLKDDKKRLVEVYSQLGDVYLAMNNWKEENQDSQGNGGGKNLLVVDCQQQVPVMMHGKNRESQATEVPKKNIEIAEYYLNLAEAIAEQLKDDSLRAVLLNEKGNVSMMKKEYEKAILAYRDSLKYSNDQVLKANVSVNLIQSYLEVLSAYQENMRFFEQFGDKIATLDYIKLKEEIGDVTKALQNFLRQMKVIFGNTATIEVDKLQQLLQNLEKKKKEKDSPGAIEVINGFLQQKKTLTATLLQQLRIRVENELTATLTLVRNLSDSQYSHDKAFALMGLAQLAKKLDNVPYERSCASPSDSSHRIERLRFEALEQARKIIDRQDNKRTSAYAKGYLAQLYADKQCYLQAIKLTEDAISDSLSYPKPFQEGTIQMEVWGYPELLFQWEWQLGKFLRVQGDSQKFIDAYRRAVEHLKRVRKNCGVASKTFNQKAIEFYFELADLLLLRAELAQSEGKTETEQDLLKEVIGYIELSQRKELQNYFQDDCVTEKEAFQQTGDSQLSSTTAIFYPVLLENSQNSRLELLLKFDGSVKRFQSFVGKENVEGFKNEAKNLWEKTSKKLYYEGRFSEVASNNYTDDNAYNSHANQLYKWLIGPLVKDLEANKIDTLVVVPHKTMLTIPFSVLCNECTKDTKHNVKEQKFLIQRIALVITPGWELTDFTEVRRGGVEALLNGLIEAQSPIGENFPKLPHAKEEIEEVKKILGTGELLSEKLLVMENLETHLRTKRYSIVHFATHGHFDPNPNNIFLLVYNEKLGLDRLERLFSLPYLQQEAPIELMVLSACESALGNEQEATLGLAGTAIKTGVRSVIATIWPVAEASTLQLVKNFYTEVRIPYVSKATALKEAQVSIMGGTYADPFFWGGFLMIGNWQPLF